MTLTEFLLARIAEDEAAAKAATPGRWESWVEGRDGYGGDDVILTRHDDLYVWTTWQQRSTQDHIARHNPARVLAECEAKRRIVVDYLATAKHELKGDPVRAGMYVALGEVLIDLAAVYADHPDYDEAWRI